MKRVCCLPCLPLEGTSALNETASYHMAVIERDLLYLIWLLKFLVSNDKDQSDGKSEICS